MALITRQSDFYIIETVLMSYSLISNKQSRLKTKSKYKHCEPSLKKTKKKEEV